MTIKKIKLYAPGDCLTCQNCAIAVSMDNKPLPPNRKYFCIAHERPLISWYKKNIYITGIEKAATCPKFKLLIDDNRKAN